MDINQALDYIHGTYKFGIKLGLKNIGRLLELMGNPHKRMRYVHVAGTNGKGSTVAFISSILMAAGYKTGIYTSPFIQRYNERMKINECEISDGDLSRITSFVKEKADIMVSEGSNHPTEFEIGTAIAFQYFCENRCDIVVLEVGMGGRFDSTNIIDTPLVSVITTISYDHMEWLGDTLPEIAGEKAGIIKPRGKVVLYPQPEEVKAVFEMVCREKEADLYKVDFCSIQLKSFNLHGQIFDFEKYKTLEIKLLGDHQVKNACVAVKTAELLNNNGLDIDETSVREGLSSARWPGRMEKVHDNPVFIIDGAHNAEGAGILAGNLKKYFPDKKIKFIVGVLRDKDYKSLIEAINPIASAFFPVTPNNSRALPAKDLVNFINSYCKSVYLSDTIVDAINNSIISASPDDIICACGSLYFIGEVREYFQRLS
ncbi:MAG: folylpolyglutamate synthase/dihydrofolate synthase family protein [Bacillota bacterium]|nr:folylpolyglutamate synthase/dihydrofolate synthase family protein [Bacillota bacterium]